MNPVLIPVVILFILGLIGTIMPVLPGVVFIFGGMLLYGFMTSFASLGLTFFVIQALFVVLIFAIDFIASAIGTRRFQGSKYAVWGAFVGALLGLFVLGPLGIIFGPILGAVIAEFLYSSDLNKAVRVGIGTFIGLIGGTLFKLGIEIVMIIYFFVMI